MRKLYAITIGVMLLSAVNGIAQCSLNITANTNDTVCVGAPTALTANINGPSTALNTTFAGGNNHRGNMFDIFATNTVTITSFDAHPMGNTTIEIYYRPSAYAGFETSSAGWTLVGSAAVTAQPFGSPTPVPVAVNVTIPAGQTYAFYVTSTNTAVSLNYTDGTSEGATYVSDANITFRQGVGMEYPFANGGGVFRPRVWNGVVHYTAPGAATYLWSTGGVTPTITDNVGATTPYFVEVNIPGCPSLLHDTIVMVVSTPTANAGSNSSVCAGNSVTLSGAGTGNPPLQFMWDNAVINNVPFQPFMTQDYVLTVIDGYGCTDTDTVNIAYNTLPTVYAGVDTIVCEGSMYTLNGSGALTYTWDNGISNGVPFTVNGTLTYEVIGTDMNGCMNNDSVTVASDTANLAVVVVNETITAVDSTATYQWIDCNTMQQIAGQTGQSFTATVNGSYAVIINNGICSDTSACQTILSTGINANGVSEIVAWPNPTDGTFILSTGFVAAKIQVVSVTGELVAEIAPLNATETISLLDSPAGVYFIYVISPDGEQTTLKVVRQ